MARSRWSKLMPICLLALFACGGNGREQTPPPIDPDTRASLTSWLTEHGKPPTDYVVQLFQDHDVVLLGEMHCLKHDVVFVQSLYKPLYQAGIRTIAIEFARREDQGRIDSLLALGEWDERLARDIMFDQFVGWGFQEYVDLFRAAWELNRELAPGAPRFRVLGVNDSPDWSVVRTRADLDDDAIKRQVWRGGGERFWAEVVLNAVAQGEKVLVYSGMHHAFSSYYHPIVIDGRFVRLEGQRMGNYVHRAIGKRAVTVFLHAPWAGPKGLNDTWGYPVGGAIDALMLGLPSGPYPVGFDLADSPFGLLSARDNLYAQGYDDFRLSIFCDGWIYFQPISKFKGVTPIKNWIHAENLERARRQTPNPDWRELTAAEFNQRVAKSATPTQWGRLR